MRNIKKQLHKLIHIDKQLSKNMCTKEEITDYEELLQHIEQ